MSIAAILMLPITTMTASPATVEVGEKRAPDRRRLAGVLASLTLCGGFTAYYTWIASRVDLSFDGAIYTRGPLALLEYGVWTNFPYHHETAADLTFQLFNQGLLSQYPLLLVLVPLLGVNHLVLQIPNLVFVFAAGLITYLLVARLARSHALALASALAIYTYPQLRFLGLQGFGELGGYFYLALCLWQLHRVLTGRGSYWVLGVTCYLCFDAKIFLLPVCGLVAMALLLDPSRSFRERVRGVLIVAGVAVLPLVVLHLLFAVSYGHEALVQAYRDFLVRARSEQYGGKAAGLPWQDKAVSAYRSLGTSYGSAPILYSTLVANSLLGLLALVRRRTDRAGRAWLPVLRRDPQSLVLLVMWIACLFFVGYWFHCSVTNQWSRKILPVLLSTIPLSALVARALAGSARRPLAFGVSAVLLLGPALVFQVSRFRSFPELAGLTAQLRDRQEMSRVLARLPPGARIHGFGWWQSPRLSLYGNRMFLDLQREVERSSGFLALSFESWRNQPAAVAVLAERYDLTPIEENAHFRLYAWERRSAPAEVLAVARFLERPLTAAPPPGGHYALLEALSKQVTAQRDLVGAIRDLTALLNVGFDPGGYTSFWRAEAVLRLLELYRVAGPARAVLVTVAAEDLGSASSQFRNVYFDRAMERLERLRDASRPRELPPEAPPAEAAPAEARRGARPAS